MILDATAGNQTMWLVKYTHNIIYLDMERKLKRKPTVYADNTNTPFPDATFDTVFYDPPHKWGGKDDPCPMYPSEIKKWKQDHVPFAFTYYGWDKYKTRIGLLRHVYYAQKEFIRILKPDGLLWFKWNEVGIPLDRIMVCFTDWIELMRLYINDPTHTASQHQTFWLVLQKKEKIVQQHALTDFVRYDESLDSALQPAQL